MSYRGSNRAALVRQGRENQNDMAMTMANKRYQESQDAGESIRKLRASLREHPMSPQEAARVICEVHTAPGGPRGFMVNFGTPPDFVKVDGEVYWEGMADTAALRFRRARAALGAQLLDTMGA